MTTDAQTIEARTNLRWCVGRFAYAAGRHHLYHFMELKDFMVEDGPEYAYLFSIRALRAGGGRLPALAETLTYWTENTPAPTLADTVTRIVGGCHEAPITIVEYYPGIGVTFEYLKHLVETTGAGGKRFEYVGCGSERMRPKFTTLHTDQYPAAYVTDAALPPRPADGASCVVYNLAEAVREGYSPRVSLDAALTALSPDSSFVLCARVVSGPGAQRATTVRGFELNLPSVNDLVSVCESFAGSWTYRYLDEFDPRFFLPGLSGRAGLLLACRTPRHFSPPGFRPGADLKGEGARHVD